MIFEKLTLLSINSNKIENDSGNNSAQNNILNSNNTVYRK